MSAGRNASHVPGRRRRDCPETRDAETPSKGRPATDEHRDGRRFPDAGIRTASAAGRSQVTSVRGRELVAKGCFLSVAMLGDNHKSRSDVHHDSRSVTDGWRRSRHAGLSGLARRRKRLRPDSSRSREGETGRTQRVDPIQRTLPRQRRSRPIRLPGSGLERQVRDRAASRPAAPAAPRSGSPQNLTDLDREGCLQRRAEDGLERCRQPIEEDREADDRVAIDDDPVARHDLIVGRRDRRRW